MNTVITGSHEFNTSSRARARKETNLTISVSQYTTAYNNNVPYLFVHEAEIISQHTADGMSVLESTVSL